MVDALIVSIQLIDKGIEVNISLKKTLKLQIDSIAKSRQNNNMASITARGDSLVINELLLRLKASFLSNDDDESNATPEELANKFEIRQRKTRRLIEEKKRNSEPKDSVMAPSDLLHIHRRLSYYHDFLAVQIFLMDLEGMVVRKDWCSAIEMWVFRQFEKGSKAHTAFNVCLKSGQGLQLNRDVKCHFRDLKHSREVFLRLSLPS